MVSDTRRSEQLVTLLIDHATLIVTTSSVQQLFADVEAGWTRRELSLGDRTIDDGMFDRLAGIFSRCMILERRSPPKMRRGILERQIEPR
jgi:hypothetical protein